MSGFWSDETLDALAACPADALHWAAAGYRGGLEDGYNDGYEQAEADMAAVWATVAADVRRRAGHPSYDELRQRRESTDDVQPCRQHCQTCSQCVRYEAWFLRGRRDYLGAAREAELARAAS